MTPIDFAIWSFAVWRVCRIVVMESGPADVFDRLRVRLGVHKGETWMQRGLACIGCISFWLGLAASAWIGGAWPDILVRGLAFSAVSVILMRRVN